MPCDTSPPADSTPAKCGNTTLLGWHREGALVKVHEPVRESAQKAQWVKNLPVNAGDTGDPWVGKIPGRRKRQPTPAFVPGDSHGQMSLVGYSPWARKESDMTEHLSTHTHTHTQIMLK